MGEVSVVRVWHWSVAVCHEWNRVNRGVAVVFDYCTTPCAPLPTVGRSLALRRRRRKARWKTQATPKGFAEACATLLLSPRALARKTQFAYVTH